MGWSAQKSEINLCLLPLIESERAGDEIVALAADVIAAEARFNSWCADQKSLDAKRSDAGWQDTADRWLEMLDPVDELTKECQTRVQAFLAAGDREQLVETLARLRDLLSQRAER